MNTRQYHYLSTIAEYGSLSGAARALQLSPSTLSKFLAELERTLGATLFLRRGHRLSHRGRAGCHRACTKYTV